MFKIAQSYIENSKALLNYRLSQNPMDEIFTEYLKYIKAKQIRALNKKYIYNPSHTEEVYLKNLI